MATFRIPIYQPSLSGKEKEYVNDCIDSTWISSKGKYIPLFEQAFGKYIGIKHAASVCNGTLAIHLALIALGIGPDDEVIVPTLTYIASVNAISYTGAVPVFADSLIDTWQIDPFDVEKKITSKTKAVMAVHLYGHPCELAELRSTCDKHGLFLIEDCAEAIGSKYNGKHVGTIGDIAAFSFFGNKTITTGEGGMVVTNDATLYDRCVHYKGQGLAKHREYWHDVIGYNYRMTNICAAIGLAQLEQIAGFIVRKRAIADKYKTAFSDTSLVFHKEAPEVVHSYWMCTVLVHEPEQRDALREYLKERGIETRPTFYPVHTMPMYAAKYQKHEVAEYLGWRGVNLPSFPAILDADLNYVIDSVKNFF